MADRDAAQAAETLNPYASPSIVDDVPAAQPEWLVDGNCIVVGSLAILPQRCIFTGEEVASDDRRRRRLDWAPTFRLVLRHRHCYVSYCVNRRHRYLQYRIRLLFALLAMAATWLVLGNNFLWVLPVIPAVSVAIPMDSLRIATYRNGRFWIAGFSAEFLAACAAEASENGRLLSPKAERQN